MPSVHKGLKDKHAEMSAVRQANERGLQAEADYFNRLHAWGQCSSRWAESPSRSGTFP